MKDYTKKTITLNEKVFDTLTQEILYNLGNDLANSTEIVMYKTQGIAQDVLARVTISAPAEEILNIEYESSVWQLLKKRIFPKFLLRYFPVKHDSIKAFFLHPEISSKPNSPNLYYAVRHIINDSEV